MVLRLGYTSPSAVRTLNDAEWACLLGLPEKAQWSAETSYLQGSVRAEKTGWGRGVEKARGKQGRINDAERGGATGFVHNWKWWPLQVYNV